MKTGKINAPKRIKQALFDLLSQKFVVWMVGSQLNPKVGKPPNDWDFIVEGNEDLLQKMAALPAVKKMDLMIITNGDDFYKPWKNPTSTAGSKSGWKFKIDPVNANFMTYKSSDFEYWQRTGKTKRAIGQQLAINPAGEIIFA